MKPRMDTRDLIGIGERLGLSGEELWKWVQVKQKHLRDERALERKHERVKLVQERGRAEVEERNLQLRIRFAELKAARAEGAQTDDEEEIVVCSGCHPAKLQRTQTHAAL